MELQRIFEGCWSAIGGEANPDIQWYRERPKEITRDTFFESAVWAIWVSGLARRSAEPFLNRIEWPGDFDDDFTTFAALDYGELCTFIQQNHGHNPPHKACQKWEAVWRIARWLNSYPTEEAFRADVFRGKPRSAELDETDGRRLERQGLPWIGPANAQFIIRNMGGEAIKCDRRIEDFLEYTGLSLKELREQVCQLGIPLGLFDLVIWAYCEKYVGKGRELAPAFDVLMRSQAT